MQPGFIQCFDQNQMVIEQIMSYQVNFLLINPLSVRLLLLFILYKKLEIKILFSSIGVRQGISLSKDGINIDLYCFHMLFN